ncbi:MAG: AAA family ATPase [Synergistales bacterium]|nr:AAA family ATPase [Bacteroidales bacterium]MDY6394529.1 AAA family ATPase [Bacteroidales bacterium]MDY6402494.1 AAA family ATPase [Bacteroidales bacterium]MDY6424402.1 AAA family ATPase [Bacteroidales bacterium]MDY6435739.1 AAA family ATPase [Synergistales bacterium]
MAFYLGEAIFINRAPFEHLELDFKEKCVSVLTAANGKGKTTILSHLVDAFYELAKLFYDNEFEGIENKYYRVSSSIFSIKQGQPSIVYFRFLLDNKQIDYVDIREQCSQEYYDKNITISDKIQFSEISRQLKNHPNIKYWKLNSNKNNIVESIFNSNLVTYFPSYRYEMPSFLNNPFQFKIDYKLDNPFSGYLTNQIEVITGIRQIANWLMDVVLDWEVYKTTQQIQLPNGKQKMVDVTPEYTLWNNINNILRETLSSKKIDGSIRFGIGKRNNAGSRLAIVSEDNNGTQTTISPNIFCLSSGELAIICCFGELLRQADRIKPNVSLQDIQGIVLIDEVDKHLHIKLQKEILPKLFNLFPNVQFIVSSHSPFLNMGLADETIDRTQIIDLDNNGIVCGPTNNDLYREVYEMMIQDNQRFADRYNDLVNQIKINTKPLIITEGKTDYRHIKKAIEILGRNDIDVDFFQVPDKWGSSKLKEMLESISRIKQQKIIIGIFDRDESEYLSYLDVENQQYKTYGDSNVYAFAIPLVNENIYGDKISIEHYYAKNILLKEDSVNHRRLFLGSEFYASGNSKDGKYQTKISNIKHKVDVNGIIDEKVFDSQDLEQVNSIALTKDAFASLIETDIDYINDFNFDSFNQLLNIIDSITKLPLYT